MRALVTMKLALTGPKLHARNCAKPFPQKPHMVVTIFSPTLQKAKLKDWRFSMLSKLTCGVGRPKVLIQFAVIPNPVIVTSLCLLQT